MATIRLFPGATPAEDNSRFKWQHMPLSMQFHYNFLLNKVIKYDQQHLHNGGGLNPNYYNINFCLALGKCSDRQPSVGLPENGDKNPCVVDFSEGVNYIQLPGFRYQRSVNLQTKIPIPPTNTDELDLTLDIKSMTIGSLIWLYYYERMGIFKILGALMDDYNYRGTYPISARIENNAFANQYTDLMENISLLYRVGLSSNLRDRVCTYQRVLGVTIENNMNIESEKNEGFMKTFNKLIDYMLEFYKAKQLAQAIQNTSATVRSSVATQTSIRDTILVMKQHLEAMEYGRNMINTFAGVATVYMTICLVRLIKDEIGIPRQYEAPEEFIPAAYDLLVLKRSAMPAAINRFTIYDNCASYGYRLLTDIQLADVNQFRTSALHSPLDLWLNDVEGIVEGYNNAYKAVEEPASMMAMG